MLSQPILRNPAFDRRLLLSTFIHELIHCYLFINCGFEARIQGGHTEGFLRIARVIDGWVGEGFLGLCHVKADLDAFRKEEGGYRGWGGEACVGCDRSPRRDGDDEGFVREGYV